MFAGTARTALAILQRVEGGRPRLQSVQMVAAGDDAALTQLAEGLRNSSCHNTPTTCVLAPGSYVLHQLEPPAVPPEEMKSAVRWQLRDVLDAPVDQVQVDFFPLPALPSQKKLGYAVAAHNDKIQAALQRADRLNLPCQTIDIAELCLARLLAQAEAGKAMAGLLLADGSGLLVILWDGAVIMARSLVFAGSDGDAQAQEIEQLALDIQRSLDYCESSLTRRPVREVVLLPSRSVAAQIATGLAQLLTPDVRVLELGAVFQAEGKAASFLPAPCLLALGAALREVGE